MIESEMAKFENAAQPPGQLLGVAQRVQPADVVVAGPVVVVVGLDHLGGSLDRFQDRLELSQHRSPGPRRLERRGRRRGSRPRRSSQAANSGAGRRPKSRRTPTASW